MVAPSIDSRSLLARVHSVRSSGADGVILRVTPAEAISPQRAGRFFMLRREDGLSPAIPRPFSLYRQVDGDLEFMIKVVGTGTQALANSKAGEDLRLIGPLGNGWPTLDAEGLPWVLLGGGIGSAPFYLAMQQAQSRSVHFIYGGATADHLYELSDFQALSANVLTATDDGSRGFHGHTVASLEDQWEQGSIPQAVRLLACGPEPMLRAVAKLARERSLECWLSLETLMGCGVGICNGCVVPTEPEGELGEWPNAKCCVEGPVFPSDAIRLT